jgi:uncharacterized protein (TIGR02646 family)
MRALDRNAVAAPSCLNAHDHNNQEWRDLDSVCKKAVRAALDQIQSNGGIPPVCCAYCESPISSKNSHLEHFRRKRHHPALTFDWDNLFLSCDSSKHCGHYKDRKDAPAYDPADLIKPDVNDPDAFLYFHSSGRALARGGLSTADKQRAEETIRVFGLNESTLQASRRIAARRYRSEEYLASLQLFKPSQRLEYLEMEIGAVRGLPYFSTIKHTLQTL